MKAMDQISNESRANPNNTDPQVSQSYQTRARAAAVTAIQQYDGKYRQDALRYREELLLRVGPGLHDARMDGEYDPAVPFAQFLHDIALDLQTLASNLKEK
jgi:hypothetical protein